MLNPLLFTTVITGAVGLAAWLMLKYSKREYIALLEGKPYLHTTSDLKFGTRLDEIDLGNLDYDGLLINSSLPKKLVICADGIIIESEVWPEHLKFAARWNHLAPLRIGFMRRVENWVYGVAEYGLADGGSVRVPNRFSVEFAKRIQAIQ